MIFVICSTFILIIYFSLVQYYSCTDHVPWSSQFSKRDCERIEKEEAKWQESMKKLREKQLMLKDKIEDFIQH